MSDQKPMKEIWEIREQISDELASLSDEDFLNYVRQRREEWATTEQIEALEKMEEASRPSPPVVRSQE